jgi:signal peptidase I
MRNHVHKLFNHQRDLLTPLAVDSLQDGIQNLTSALQRKAPKEELVKEMSKLESVAGKWLKPYPHAVWRENVEVLLVALAIAMGIRTFFLQPFKIPTGSMQPTLYGVTSENLKATGGKIPSGLERVREWFRGVSYLHVVAKEDGELLNVGRPFRFLIFNIRQTFTVGNRTYTLWFPPDYGNANLELRAGLSYRQYFSKGDDIIKVRISAGDHLFVDRVTYNFRPPARGEIIVFETKGIPEEKRTTFGIPGDQFYIKRLVGLSGERVQIGEDRHLRVNGRRLSASVPHFENVYSFDANAEPQDSHYSGHVNRPHLAPFFSGKADGVLVPEGEFMTMGDNTMNSLDSRAWGTFPASYVIGKSFFVYWPITDRFGWGYHR